VKKIKILIIHTAFIGDIVLSTPLISKIYDTYESCEITYLTNKNGASILENNPKLSNIMVYDKRGDDKGLKSFFKIIKKVKSEKFDIAFIPHRYLRSTLIGFLSGIPQRIGYNVAAFNFLFTKKILYDKNKHEVEKLLSFVSENKKNDYNIELYPSKKDEKEGNILTGDIKSKKLVIIAPGTKWKTKQWPIDYFNYLIEKLNKRKDTIIGITGGVDEKDLNMAQGRNIIDLRGKTTLLELTAIMKKGDILLSNDSSPIHIASAFPQLKIYAIFGPTVKEFGFFPWSKNSKVYEIMNLPCRSCGIHGGNKCKVGHFRCMRDIKPQIILENIERELDGKNKN
jgi:heptosyltransferase-2